jgi:hypothetical protein
MSRLRTVSWKSRCDRILDQSTSGSFGRSASVADVSISHLRTSSIAPGFILSRTAFTLTSRITCSASLDGEFVKIGGHTGGADTAEYAA